MADADISVVLTTHREGYLLGPTIDSCIAAIEAASGMGKSIEVVVVQDRCDELTRSMAPQHIAKSLFGVPTKVMETDLGDPGLARNHGVEASSGRSVTFLDGDDLWGANWLVRCSELSEDLTIPMIFHSEVNIVFGKTKLVWVHPSSLDLQLSLDELILFNYWDAMVFSRRETLLNSPFVENDLKAGFGHEDWHWACQTLSEGIHHVPVPGTVHFKRSRKGSQMSLCDDADVVVRENGLITRQGIEGAQKKLREQKGKLDGSLLGRLCFDQQPG